MLLSYIKLKYCFEVAFTYIGSVWKSWFECFGVRLEEFQFYSFVIKLHFAGSVQGDTVEALGDIRLYYQGP